MKYLLGDLLDPIESPLSWFCLIGFLSHWSWSWLGAWLISGLVGQMLGAWAASKVAGRAQKEFLNTYLGDTSGQYYLNEIPLEPAFLKIFDIVPAVGASRSGPTSATVRVFVVRATTLKWKLKITSRCLYNPDGPIIIFLRRPLEDLDAAGWFEVLHEVGHASHGGLETELSQYGEIPAIALSATVLRMVFPHNAFVLWFLIVYGVFRMIRWVTWVRFLEAEVAADAYAIKRLAEQPFDPPFALQAAQDYLTFWIDEFKQTRGGVRKIELFYRIRALRMWEKLIINDDQKNIPYHPRMQQKLLFFMFVIVFLILTLSAGDFPRSALILMCLTWITAITDIGRNFISREKMNQDIIDRIQCLLRPAA